MNQRTEDRVNATGIVLICIGVAAYFAWAWIRFH